MSECALKVGFVGATRTHNRVTIVSVTDDGCGFLGDNGRWHTKHGHAIGEWSHAHDIVGPWEDKPAPDYNNGEWWTWSGGECPVHQKSVVQVVLKKGIYADLASGWSWGLPDTEVCSFRVLKVYVEPLIPEPPKALREYWVLPDSGTCWSVKPDHGDPIHVREVQK